MPPLLGRRGFDPCSSLVSSAGGGHSFHLWVRLIGLPPDMPSSIPGQRKCSERDVGSSYASARFPCRRFRRRARRAPRCASICVLLFSSSFAQVASGIHGRPRGLGDRSGHDIGDIPNTWRFAIATAHALLPCGSILRFMRRHSSAHRVSPSSGTDVADCYACAMTGSSEMVYSRERAPIHTEEHSP